MPFDGSIDTVTPEGYILGWACRHDRVERLHVGISQGGRRLAEAIAQEFRPDLLDSGHGLGHCGFGARLWRTLPPGEYEFDLELVGLAASVRSFEVTVPPLRSAPAGAPAPPRIHWTDEHVLAASRCFRLAEQLSALGPERFVDGAYRFVLGRWAEPAMVESVRSANAAGRFDPEVLFRDLLQSEERRGRAGEPLPTPFDLRFPFRYPISPPARSPSQTAR